MGKLRLTKVICRSAEKEDVCDYWKNPPKNKNGQNDREVSGNKAKITDRLTTLIQDMIYSAMWDS